MAREESRGNSPYSRWKNELHDVAVQRSGALKKKFVNLSNIEIKPLYTPDDVKNGFYEAEIGYPGTFPFTRGVYPSMYRSRLWTMRQFAGLGTAEDTNQRFKYLINNGQTGLSVAFHLPTLYGWESGHEMTLGEIGKEGVAIDTLVDMEVLFDGIDLGKISTSMTINGPASILLAMYIAVGEKQGVPMEKLTGTIQNDILKEYIAQKSWIFPPEPSMRLIVDTIEFCTKHVPKWNTISISGYHIREAGATAVQELAFTLADGFAYVEAVMARGLDVDDFAPRLSFFFNAHNDFFEEVAKYRAARKIWAKRMKEKYGAKKEDSWRLRFHTQTAGVSLQAQEPENNIVRVTLQALAAVLGGTQSLHTNSFDEALALPSEHAVKIALRTQQIIAHESGVTNTIDPLAGSYFVENLTDRMEAEAEKYFKQVEDLGGVIPAIRKNFFQMEISRSAYEYQKQIESSTLSVVGVNFQSAGKGTCGSKIDLLKVSDEIAERQIARVQEIKRTRNKNAVSAALDKVRGTARGTGNLMYPILDAVKAHATVGEIIDVLKDVFGVYKEDAIF